MKTKNLFFTAAAVVILLSGCVGTKALGVLDESVPAERLAHLEIRNSMSVILWNNQPVIWSPGLIENKVTVSLPPGQHSFTVRWYETQGQGAAETDVAVTANVAAEFLPGHSYRIYMQKIWLIFITIRNVKIKDVTKN